MQKLSYCYMSDVITGGHVLSKVSHVSILYESCIGFGTALFGSQLVPLTAGQKPKQVFVLVVSPHDQRGNTFTSALGWISLLVSLAEKKTQNLVCLNIAFINGPCCGQTFPPKINAGHRNDRPLINHSFKST